MSFVNNLIGNFQIDKENTLYYPKQKIKIKSGIGNLLRLIGLYPNYFKRFILPK